MNTLEEKKQFSDRIFSESDRVSFWGASPANASFWQHVGWISIMLFIIFVAALLLCILCEPARADSVLEGTCYENSRSASDYWIATPYASSTRYLKWDRSAASNTSDFFYGFETSAKLTGTGTETYFPSVYMKNIATGAINSLTLDLTTQNDLKTHLGTYRTLTFWPLAPFFLDPEPSAKNDYNFYLVSVPGGFGMTSKLYDPNSCAPQIKNVWTGGGSFFYKDQETAMLVSTLPHADIQYSMDLFFPPVYPDPETYLPAATINPTRPVDLIFNLWGKPLSESYADHDSLEIGYRLYSGATGTLAFYNYDFLRVNSYDQISHFFVNFQDLNFTALTDPNFYLTATWRLASSTSNFVYDEYRIRGSSTTAETQTEPIRGGGGSSAGTEEGATTTVYLITGSLRAVFPFSWLFHFFDDVSNNFSLAKFNSATNTALTFDVPFPALGPVASSTISFGFDVASVATDLAAKTGDFGGIDFRFWSRLILYIGFFFFLWAYIEHWLPVGH